MPPRHNIKYSVYTGDNDSATEAHIRQKVGYKIDKISYILHRKSVMDKGVWKPGISMQVFVPSIWMTEAIYQKNIYISLVADVMLRVYKDPRINIRSPLMKKTLDRSVDMLGRECNLCVMITFII